MGICNTRHVTNAGSGAIRDKPSIAVLPFEALDREPAYPFLGDAIAEEVITALSRIHVLRVIARGSSFQYRTSVPDVRTVAAELEVRHVVQGSIRVSGDRVRVTAHLSDATTGDEMWSDRYDRTLDDVFAVQDDIAGEIATALEVKLGYGEQVRQWHRGTPSLAAYEHFANWLDEYLKFSRQTNGHARREALAAIDVDPKFASARVALGHTYATEAHLCWSEDRSRSLDHARQAVQAAMDIVPDLPEANVLLGRILMLEGRHDDGIDITGKALEDLPNYALGYHIQAMNMVFAGRFAEGIEADRQVFVLCPLSDFYSENARLYLATGYCQLGRFDHALEELGRVIENRPAWLAARAMRVVARVGRGDLEAGRDEARRILRIKPTFSTTWWATLNPYKEQKDLEAIIGPLLQAGLPESPGQSDLLTDEPDHEETASSGRVLVTVLFTDIVGSTLLAVELGDDRWRDTIDAHDEMAVARLKTHDGRLVKSTGDGIFAVFDRPGDALRCARDLAGRAVALGFRLRAGIHTGEVEIRGDDLAGIAIHIAARVAARAGADEILLTHTVKDLVAGSQFVFESKGTTELRGVPGEQELFSARA